MGDSRDSDLKRVQDIYELVKLAKEIGEKWPQVQRLFRAAHDVKLSPRTHAELVNGIKSRREERRVHARRVRQLEERIEELVRGE